MSKKIFISAIEPSADLHGSHLVKALLRQDPELICYGYGGQHLKATGIAILDDLTDRSTIGFIEPIRHLFRFAIAYFRIKKELQKTRPDLVVVIDAQGFHLPVLKAAKALGLKTAYFITPQEWHWGSDEGGKSVIAVTDLLICIFKQEAEFYSRLGGHVAYVGHPLVDSVVPKLSPEALRNTLNLSPTKPILAIFPGSRKQELALTAPVLLEAASLISRKKDIQPVISVAALHLEQKIRALAIEARLPFATFYTGDSASLIQAADLSLTTSGTITLEHAILKKLAVVAYKFSPLSYRIAKFVLRKKLEKLRFMALPNMLADAEIFPEFFQDKATASALASTGLALLDDATLRTERQSKLDGLPAQLGDPGVLDRAATALLTTLH
ncbi:MAG: lipid-A-disaccharide synthase [Candidatus Margulisiibacteriota bacterium]